MASDRWMNNPGHRKEISAPDPQKSGIRRPRLGASNCRRCLIQGLRSFNTGCASNLSGRPYTRIFGDRGPTSTAKAIYSTIQSPSHVQATRSGPGRPSRDLGIQVLPPSRWPQGTGSSVLRPTASEYQWRRRLTKLVRCRKREPAPPTLKEGTLHSIQKFGQLHRRNQLIPASSMTLVIDTICPPGWRGIIQPNRPHLLRKLRAA